MSEEQRPTEGCSNMTLGGRGRTVDEAKTKTHLAPLLKEVKQNLKLKSTVHVSSPKSRRLCMTAVIQKHPQHGENTILETSEHDHSSPSIQSKDHSEKRVQNEQATNLLKCQQSNIKTPVKPSHNVKVVGSTIEPSTSTAVLTETKHVNLDPGQRHCAVSTVRKLGSIQEENDKVNQTRTEDSCDNLESEQIQNHTSDCQSHDNRFNWIVDVIDTRSKVSTVSSTSSNTMTSRAQNQSRVCVKNMNDLSIARSTSTSLDKLMQQTIGNILLVPKRKVLDTNSAHSQSRTSCQKEKTDLDEVSRIIANVTENGGNILNTVDAYQLSDGPTRSSGGVDEPVDEATADTTDATDSGEADDCIEMNLVDLRQLLGQGPDVKFITMTVSDDAQEKIEFQMSELDANAMAHMMGLEVDAEGNFQGDVSKNKRVKHDTPVKDVILKEVPTGRACSKSIQPLILRDGTINCQLCAYRTDRKSNWYKHKQTHLGVKRVFQCDQCVHKASSSSNLTRHMLTHTGAKTHECPICHEMFRQKIHCDRHIKYKHETNKVHCPYCDHSCANYNPDLKAHLKHKHLIINNQLVQIRCKHCDFIATSKKDFKQHMKFHKSGPELKIFCQQCSFVTDCESRLKRHKFSHTQEKPHVCHLCSYRASQKIHLQRHMLGRHNIEPPHSGRRTKIEIDHVESQQADDNALIGMKRDISPKRKYIPVDYSKCVKQFPCLLCTMKFAKLINLYKHLQVQHKDKQPDLKNPDGVAILSCIVCDYRTTRRHNLLTHMRKHNLRDTNNQIQRTACLVYTCVSCDFTHTRKRAVHDHMQQEHHLQVVSECRDDGSVTSTCLIDDVYDVRSDGAIKCSVVELVNGGGLDDDVIAITSDTVLQCEGSVSVAGNHDDIVDVIDEDATAVGGGGGGCGIPPPVLADGKIHAAVDSCKGSNPASATARVVQVVLPGGPTKTVYVQLNDTDDSDSTNMCVQPATSLQDLQCVKPIDIPIQRALQLSKQAGFPKGIRVNVPQSHDNEIKQKTDITDANISGEKPLLSCDNRSVQIPVRLPCNTKSSTRDRTTIENATDQRRPVTSVPSPEEESVDISQNRCQVTTSMSRKTNTGLSQSFQVGVKSSRAHVEGGICTITDPSHVAGKCLPGSTTGQHVTLEDIDMVPEQVANLTAGDYVEVDGEMYMVQITQ